MNGTDCRFDVSTVSNAMNGVDRRVQSWSHEIGEFSDSSRFERSVVAIGCQSARRVGRRCLKDWHFNLGEPGTAWLRRVRCGVPKFLNSLTNRQFATSSSDRRQSGLFQFRGCIDQRDFDSVFLIERQMSIVDFKRQQRE